VPFWPPASTRLSCPSLSRRDAVTVPPGRALRARSGISRALIDSIGMAWRAGRAALLGQLVVAVLTGLAPVAAAWLLRSILDELAAAHHRRDLLLLAIGLAAAGGLTGLLPNLGTYLSAQTGLKVQRQALTELFWAVTRLQGLRRLEDPHFQNRLQLAEQSGSNGPAQIVSGAITILQSGLTLCGFAVTLLVLSPIMAAVVAVAAVPAIYLERAMARQQVALITGTSHGQRRQHFYQQLLTSLNAAKEIRIFGLGAFFHGRMLDELADVQHAAGRVNRKVLVCNTVMAAIGALVTACGLVWAILAAAEHRLTIGDVAVFVTALGMVAGAITMIVSTAAFGYRSLLLFASYRNVLMAEPDLPVRADPFPACRLRRGIEVDDVWFRYGPDQPWVLRGVTCFIPHGQALALVGENGAGKSTIVKLLCRLYDPERGRILWDGIDLRDLDLAGFRDRISVVFQDYMSYELSAAENIGLGDLKLAGHDEALTAAARRAGIHEKLTGLPRGYQTILSRSYYDLDEEGNPLTGVLLSGGQWQRLALARAFLRGDRDLMILDEPSSGLDPAAEHEIHVSLTGNRHDSATVLISHRLNTIRDADHIVVLSGGHIAEQGSHDVLMAQAGIYARLFSLQAKGYAAAITATGGGSD
jgi:ATP-binding cassette, subfamily B, bacterial